MPRTPPGTARRIAPVDGGGPPGDEPGNDNKTTFTNSLDTGFSFEVEDREILFYRVKPLLPERRWTRDASTAIEGTKFDGLNEGSYQEGGE